jgi:hypothetical protein
LYFSKGSNYNAGDERESTAAFAGPSHDLTKINYELKRQQFPLSPYSAKVMTYKWNIPEVYYQEWILIQQNLN